MTKQFAPIFYKSELWVVLLCTACLQLPDLKIAGLQLAEIIMLLLLPFVIKQIFKSKTTICFLLYYVLFFLKTLVFNHFTVFYINDEQLAFLKHPGFISLARLVEMFACISFCSLIVNVFISSKNPYNLLKGILFIQIMVLGLIYISIYLMYSAHLLSTSNYDNLIVYDSSEGGMVYRLKGFFVEGGPFGLFYAFLFTICVAFYKKLNLTPWYLILCIVPILFAQSKAGYMMVLLNGGLFLASKVKMLFKSYLARFSLYAIIVVGLTLGTVVVLQMYIASLSDIEERTANFAPGEIDPNFMMGRISATVIVPNMIRSQYLQGIGWGNYPLTRNNPAYREFMPEIPVSMWDATGLGGILDMLLEAGVILFVFYAMLYTRIIMIIKKKLPQSNYLVLALIGPLLLGVAIYFFYTWFLLGIVLFCFHQISDKESNDLNEDIVISLK